MFHVPDHGRVADHPLLGTTPADGNNGAFDIDSCLPGWRLTLICSDGLVDGDLGGWEHVSVHAYRYDGRQRRTPSWDEMCFVKAICWDANDCVMQLHPSRSQYVNNHPNVLHLWRPIREMIPTPPTTLV
jgi:hypothetical protein